MFRREHRETTRLDLSHAPEGSGNDAISALTTSICETRDGISSLDLTVGKEELPSLSELVSCCRGSLKLSSCHWEPANLQHLCSGLDKNRALERLAVDWENCQHSNEDYGSLFASIQRHCRIESFELCLYQEVSDVDVTLDETSGKAAGDMLENGTLKHVSFVNWHGYVMSTNFVSELSRGLSNSTSILSLELQNCTLPAGSHGFLSSALRANRGTLTNLTVDIGEATLRDMCELFQALQSVQNLKTLRIIPRMLPNDYDVANALETSVRKNVSIQHVNVEFPNVSKHHQARLDFFLKANRFLSPFRGVLESPEPVARGLWPSIVAQLGQNPKENECERVKQAHVLYHHALRPALPWLLSRDGT